MKFEINNNHPLCGLAPLIAQYCSDFTQHHKLSYFQYLRCYADGSIVTLVNTPELAKILFQAGFTVQSSFAEDNEKMTSYVFFWDEDLPEAPVRIAREKLGMYHGMTILKRYKGFYDMIGFAMAAPRRNAMSYYATHLKSFEKFAENFIKTRSDLLALNEKEKIHLPAPFQDPNRLKICLSDRQRRFVVRGKFGESYLTTQEIFCLQFLDQGKSYKEISGLLEISPRTIETYLGRIKVRTGFQTREQILLALSTC